MIYPSKNVNYKLITYRRMRENYNLPTLKNKYEFNLNKDK